ncbi:MAG: glucose-6-phosphate isomerase, partial [Sphaerochaetaceae bacterium]|nr:glucose-6-phosphate isomerase [Sphaerochaetaceae bacterium]
MNYSNLNGTKAFKALAKLTPFDVKSKLTASRISHAAISAGGGLTYNYGAMPIDDSHIETFVELAQEQQLIEKYTALISGEIMNIGEQRLVLHHLTRGKLLGNHQLIYADGEEKGAFYHEQLARIEAFSAAVRNGKIKGSTGKNITKVVQIGIGGSDLGPRALYLALKGYCVELSTDILEARFISNVDPDDPTEILEDLDFESTLFIIVSKSGTTQETLTNQEFVIKAMNAKQIKGLVAAKHIVAVTSKTSPLASSSNVLDAFFIDDYIGGRYSSTSAVGGVVLSLAYGFDIFKRFLAGAHDADLHALQPDVLNNAAMMDALIGVYLRNVLHLPGTAVLPYSQALSRFPAHLQQLD